MRLTILKSEDFLPTESKVSFKSMVKSFLQRIGLYKSIHGPTRVASFFLMIYVERQAFTQVLFKIETSNLPKRLSCYVNGKNVKLEHLDKNFYLASADGFYEYENIISIPCEMVVKHVNVYPVVENENLDEKQILARHYSLVIFDNGLERLICRRSIDLKGKIIKNVYPSYSCILNAQISDHSCPFNGLYYPTFDLHNKTYRLVSWVWTNAIIVKLFLEEAERDVKTSDFFRHKARELTDTILKFQVEGGDNAGSFMARWDIFDSSYMGISPQLSTNDSAFIGTNALLPAYNTFGDEGYLQAAKKLGYWLVQKGMANDGRFYMGVHEDTGQWVKNYLFVDAGFTIPFFAELYKLTCELQWLKALQKFTNWFIKNMFDFQRGVFCRNWYADRTIDRTIFSRGQAWAMDGLLSAYETTLDGNYLEILNKMSESLMKFQSKDGYWFFYLDKPNSGCCSKGTPIIAFHLLRLYEFNNDKRILAAVKKAMEWCEKATNTLEEDGRVYGGIHGKSVEGTMYGARNVDSIFMYSICYFLLLKHKMEEFV